MITSSAIATPLESVQVMSRQFDLAQRVESYSNISTIGPTQFSLLQILGPDYLVDQFIKTRDRKESTLSTYRRSLKAFLDWVDRSGHRFHSLTRQDLIDYKKSLVNEGKLVSTITSYVTTLKLFYSFLEAEGVCPNLAKVLTLPKQEKRFRHQPLEPEQVKDLLKATKETGSLRDFAILNLLVRTGLRCIEVTRLNVEDITFKGYQRVILIQGKGRDEKDNFVSLTDSAYQPIAEYLQQRGPVKPTDPLFVSESNRDRGERMTTRSVSRIAKTILKEIGLSDRVFSAHSLRHTMAVSVLRAGGNLTDCQDILRHSNPATTQIYTAFIDEERRVKRFAESLIDNLY